MLTQVHINNLITIKNLQLDFASGTTVITGETGAGKSILIDAIELALGGRAFEHVVRPGQEKADISLCFDIRTIPEAQAWLKQYDLNQTPGECIIRRSISKDGRSRSYINSMPTTLQPLRELSELLIDIHGQHEHQSLLKSEKQRQLLDHFAGHQQLVAKVEHLAAEGHVLQESILQLQKLSAEHQARSEFLKFQLQELEELHLLPDEFQHLDLEHKQLAHADELLQNMAHALSVLAHNDESNSMRLVQQAIHHLETVQQVDPKIAAWIENLKTALIHISETEDEIERHLETVNQDPKRLEYVEQRISTLFNLARKHKIAPNELLEFQHKLSDELFTLENSDERLTELTSRLKTVEKNYQDCAAKLSQSRVKAAKKLANEITASIKELALPQADFHIHFDHDNIPLFSAYGLEKIIFQIKTNAGQPMQPLAKIASGGELSRVGLAIHIATAEQHTIPTLIFDEVDVGISGSTAEIVGKLLRRLGKTHQVLCITHLPQVAAQGHHHLRVGKSNAENMTLTQIEFLSVEEKINEVARLLGGVAITEATLAHAREMVGLVV